MTGPMDAAPDAGVFACGAGCGVCPSDCGSCTCQAGCTCSFECDDDCTRTCQGADTRCSADVRDISNVDLRCEDGAECVYDARQASNADVRCTGSRCDVDCTDVSNCNVRCLRSECLVDCTDASNCNLRDCEMAPTSCPDGVQVCGRDCP